MKFAQQIQDIISSEKWSVFTDWYCSKYPDVPMENFFNLPIEMQYLVFGNFLTLQYSWKQEYDITPTNFGLSVAKRTIIEAFKVYDSK